MGSFIKSKTVAANGIRVNSISTGRGTVLNKNRQSEERRRFSERFSLYELVNDPTLQTTEDQLNLSLQATSGCNIKLSPDCK
jgi:hypothetical protein